MQGLTHIIGQGDLTQREYAAILLRRLFIPDAMMDDTIVFSQCSDSVKGAITNQLLTALQNEGTIKNLSIVLLNIFDLLFMFLYCFED